MTVLLTADLPWWESIEPLLVVLTIIAIPFAVAGVIDDLIQKAAERREAERAEQVDLGRSLTGLGRAHERARADIAASRRDRQGVDRG